MKRLKVGLVCEEPKTNFIIKIINLSNGYVLYKITNKFDEVIMYSQMKSKKFKELYFKEQIA